MKTRASVQTASVSVQHLGRPCCPQCQELLLAPAASVHVDDSRVRHFWACDNCGYEFISAVRVSSTIVQRNIKLHA